MLPYKVGSEKQTVWVIKVLPHLYSFRRCPYAMRARLAIYFSQISVELREILLKNKPRSMLAVSPKGTVPVLVDGSRVIEESLDIMLWALNNDDPNGFWQLLDSGQKAYALELINACDKQFKPLLDGYKYALKENISQKSQCFEQAAEMLTAWNVILTSQPFLLGGAPTLGDLAIFPFVRQFRNVDIAAFEGLKLNALGLWLNKWLESDAFHCVMKKWAVWDEDGDASGEVFP